MSTNRYAENLRVEFFGDEQTGFYSTFDPVDGVVEVGAESVNGKKLLAALGVKIIFHGHERLFGIEQGDEIITVYPYLFRKDDAYWAGFWDGDGVAITGHVIDENWAINTDIKCDYYWNEIPNPLYASVKQTTQQKGSNA